MIVEEFLAPTGALMILTFTVWIVMFIFRIKFIIEKRIKFDNKTTRAGAAILFQPVEKYANNFSNLIEVPVFFYLLTILLILTKSQNEFYFKLSWIFVVGRFLSMNVSSAF